jgi:hypothetical protein
LIGRLAPAALLAVGASVAAAQNVVLRDAGPGAGPDIIAQALSVPYSVIGPDSTPRLIRRDSAFAHTVIAVGRTVVIEGAVHGDVIVIGGDLFMHPGGVVDGRAISIGGGVYESMLARTGPVTSFRGFTYDIASTPSGYALNYRAVADDFGPAIRLPGLYGMRIPAYDRLNGLSLRLAPRLHVPRSAVVIEPGVTYRSHLGVFDPGVAVTIPLDGRTTLRGSAERGTFTNDDWIWPDVINSAEFLFVGDDARNYYRATRGDLELSRRWEWTAATLEPYIGGRVERARSVARDSGATGAPWTIFNRRDPDDARRPNPAIDPGTIASVVAGTRLEWTDGDVVVHAKVNAEAGKFTEPNGTSTCLNLACPTPSDFVQTTLDGNISFPTFGMQSIRVDLHAVTTSGGRTPRQRFAYVGGPGSISTLELLERGGDELFFIDARYRIPIEQIQVPLVGPPTLIVREVLGGATVGRFPTLAQATGLRLGLSIFYVEVMVDPANRHVSKGFGLSLAP